MAPRSERIKIKSFGGEWEFVPLTTKGTIRKTAPRVGEPLRLGLVRRYSELLQKSANTEIVVEREEIWNLGVKQIAQRDSLLRLNKSVADTKGPRIVFYEYRGPDKYVLDKNGKKIPLYRTEPVLDAEGKYRYETVKERVKNPKTGRFKTVEMKRRITKQIPLVDLKGKRLYKTTYTSAGYGAPTRKMKTRPVMFDAIDGSLQPLRIPFYKENVYEQILNTAIITQNHETEIRLPLNPDNNESIADALASSLLELPKYIVGDELQIRSQFTMPNGTKSAINLNISEISQFVPKVSNAIVKSFASVGYRFTSLVTLQGYSEELFGNPTQLLNTKYTLVEDNALEYETGKDVHRDELLEIEHIDTLVLRVVNLTELERQGKREPRKKKRKVKGRRKGF
jgi:hypothetical protein